MCGLCSCALVTDEWFVGGGFSRAGGWQQERPGGGRIQAYNRSPDDDSNVDVAAIEALLDERSRFRERRMWSEADAVRDQLGLEHGVEVSDKEYEWWGDGGGGWKAGRSGRRERSQQRSGDWEGGDDPWEDARPLEVRAMTVPERLQTEYGILGHDYTRVAADSTPLSTDDFEPINGLLAARLEAKRARRYGEADALLEMLSEIGVTVEDNARMWRADGVPFDPKAWTRIAGDGDFEGEIVPTGGYTPVVPCAGESIGAESAAPAAAESAGAAAASDTACGPSADELRALTVPVLKDQLRAKGLKVGGRKDELVERLMEANAAATKSDGPALMTDVVAEIAVAEGECRKEESSEAPSGEAATVGGGSDAGSASGGGVDVVAVEALLEERGRAKQAKDYATADAIVETLRSVHSVVTDDKRRTWRVVVFFGGYYRVGPQVDAFTTKQIGDMLIQRTAHQEKQEYEEADALHAALTEMGVVLDTRIKTWKKPAARQRDRRK